MDIRAKKAGDFVEGLVAAGGEISVGVSLYKIDSSAKGTTAAPAEKSEKAATPAKEAAAAPAAAAAPVNLKGFKNFLNRSRISVDEYKGGSMEVKATLMEAFEMSKSEGELFVHYVFHLVL